MQNVCPVKHKFASRYQDESMLDLRSRPRPRLPLQAPLILIEIIPLNCTLNLRHFLLLNILKIVILFTRKKKHKTFPICFVLYIVPNDLVNCGYNVKNKPRK